MFAEFYKGSEIFMTGGSGVVGKAAIEKLLRSCDVKKIFVLLRCKKGVSPEERLMDMKNSAIFRVLKESKPNELDKLFVIPGDTSLDCFGISPENRELLKNVSIFFHSAATTRFDEPLQTAIRLNVKSTLEALKLAQNFHNLKIFIHVSTFFSNPYLKDVEDKVYPAVFDWRTAIKMMDNDPEIMNSITHKVITDFPNTYSFTKHLAEQLVNDHRSKLPVAIFRPSIVISAIEEPEPGFTETMNGVMGLLLVWGTGLIKVLRCSPDLLVDVTPLDIGTKFLLIFTAKVGRYTQEQFANATPVGMFSSDGILKYRFSELSDLMSQGYRSIPFEKSLWLPGIKCTLCPFLLAVYTFFLQIVPAFFIDILLRLFGQKPVMMAIQRKIAVTMKVLQFFLNSGFQSTGATDIAALIDSASGTDFDIRRVIDCCEDEDIFVKTAEIIARGCRKFLMKEDESTLPRCRRILKAKIIAYNIIRGLALYFVGSAIYRRVMSTY